MLDVAYVLWCERDGRDAVDVHLADAGKPHDEGMAAQMAQDAMLGGDLS